MARRTRFRAAATLAPRFEDWQVLGLPRAAVTITNSQRKAAACPRRWWWGEGLGYASPPSGAMRFGSAFDDVMGRLLTHYHQHGTLVGDSWPTHCDPVVAQLYAEHDEAAQDVAELDDMVLRLRRAVQGWLQLYDRSMVEDYSVVAVQPMLAVPVTSPRTGAVYRSRCPWWTPPTAGGWPRGTTAPSCASW